MTNFEWLQTLDLDGLMQLLTHDGSSSACDMCVLCSYGPRSSRCKTRSCLDGIHEWSEAEHGEDK